MKSVNQIIVRCKQPIKIAKPLQCLLPFSHRVTEIFFRLFLCHLLFQFYSLNALQNDNRCNTVYVLGHEYILGPSQSSF